MNFPPFFVILPISTGFLAVPVVVVVVVVGHVSKQGCFGKR